MPKHAAFQLDIDIPEIGAKVGDWIQAHPTKGVILSRQLSPETVALLRARLSRVLALLDIEAERYPAPRQRPEVVRG